MHTTPIFIGGLMKSGTTLLRALVSNHSGIFGGLETFWFSDRFAARFHDGASETIHRLFGFFDVPVSEHAALYRQGDDAPAFFNRFMNHCTRRAGKRRWVEKTPDNVRHLDLIQQHWPGSRFLHVIRDPRDVYASWKRNNKYDLATFLAHVAAVEEAAGDRLGRSGDTYMEVHYEDLVTRPEEIMRRVMTFLEESWEDAVAVNRKGREEFDKVRGLTGKASPTLDSLSKPIFTDSLGRWPQILSSKEIETIETQTAEYGRKSGCFQSPVNEESS
ncbi:MAG: sulfotransferase [Acidobacteriota bacterium]|nr:sulfotransferase [Acidobacteriota bacterium]